MREIRALALVIELMSWGTTPCWRKASLWVRYGSPFLGGPGTRVLREVGAMFGKAKCLQQNRRVFEGHTRPQTCHVQCDSGSSGHQIRSITRNKDTHVVEAHTLGAQEHENTAKSHRAAAEQCSKGAHEVCQ